MERGENYQNNVSRFSACMRCTILPQITRDVVGNNQIKKGEILVIENCTPDMVGTSCMGLLIDAHVINSEGVVTENLILQEEGVCGPAIEKAREDSKREMEALLLKLQMKLQRVVLRVKNIFGPK